MVYHTVYVLEGGGAKGPLHVGESEVLEQKLGHKLIDFIDLFVTTSIGGVEASVYSTGLMWVSDFWKLLEPNLKDIFTPKYPWSIPRYDWKKYLELYRKYVSSAIRFGEARKDFMFTTVNMVDGTNHFVKSWHKDYADWKMPEIVHRTFAATFYFGCIYDSVKKAIWGDGGTGFFNLPLIEAYTQILTNGWLETGHHTHILALGTGRKKYEINYDKEAKKGPVRKTAFEVKRFLSKDDGGMARAVSAKTQINTMKKLIKGHKGRLSFQWVDWFPMPKKLDKMDNWKARWDYYNKGKELGETIDLEYFQKKLKK